MNAAVCVNMDRDFTLGVFTTQVDVDGSSYACM